MDSDFEKSAELIRSSFKRLFRTLMEQTADRIYIKDTKSRFVFVSRVLARTHGFEEPEEIQGMSDFDFYDPETAQRFFKEEQLVMRTQEPLLGRVEKEVWKDGSTTWVTHSKSPLKLDAGETIGLIGISRDLTEEQESKRMLEEQNDTMRNDIASAEKVQKIMIPGRVPRVDGVQLAYLWRPMISVGGDIITFPRNPRNEPIFFMADVCGHGVQAAFYTVLLKYMTAHAAEVYRGRPDQFLNAVNEDVLHRIDNGFVTAVAGHIDPPEENGNRVVHLANAGQPDFLIYRADRKRVESGKLPGGMVMGLPGGEAGDSMQCTLAPGDRLYLFTDGIVEAASPSGEEFGLHRLASTLEAAAGDSLQESLESLYYEALSHTKMSQQQDDISLLAFENVLNPDKNSQR